METLTVTVDGAKKALGIGHTKRMARSVCNRILRCSE